MRRSPWLGGLALLAMISAGCTGDFDIKQTEPIRVEVNGEPQEARLDSQEKAPGREAKSEFVLQKDPQVQSVKVVVEVMVVAPAGPGNETATSPINTTAPPTGNATTSPTAANTTTSPTAGNATGTGTNATEPVPTDEAGQAVVILVTVEDRDRQETLAQERVEADLNDTSIELDIDVRGRNNVVVVTQAVEGVADVRVGATAEAGLGPTADDQGNATATTS